MSFIKINPMKGLLGLHIRIPALHRLEIEDCDSSRHRVSDILIGRSLSMGVKLWMDMRNMEDRILPCR